MKRAAVARTLAFAAVLAALTLSTTGTGLAPGQTGAPGGAGASPKRGRPASRRGSCPGSSSPAAHPPRPRSPSAWPRFTSPGSSVAVIDGGVIAWAKGYGV
ncbi:MAG: hypothetical protein M0C28_05400 [Candidatus Moduliflexus flocculans]|nr:hypothetical protein [Candidatus Moduliflexus flocculans]